MAFTLPSRSASQYTSQSPCSSVRSSRSRRGVVCKAVLNLEPKPRDVKQQRDVSVKANAGDEALPLPDSQPQPDIKLSPSFLDALVESTVKVPYVAYSTALREYPLATKACTSMVGFILGDLIAQVRSKPCNNSVLLSSPGCNEQCSHEFLWSAYCVVTWVHAPPRMPAQEIFMLPLLNVRGAWAVRCAENHTASPVSLVPESSYTSVRLGQNVCLAVAYRTKLGL